VDAGHTQKAYSRMTEEWPHSLEGPPGVGRSPTGEGGFAKEDEGPEDDVTKRTKRGEARNGMARKISVNFKVA